MFERYTGKARRTIFFARHEASQLGSSTIETEHLLLGLLRENQTLSAKFFRPPLTPEVLREQIRLRHASVETIPTSVDMPLSDENRRVIEYAATEAALLKDKNIGTEHLLLGLLRQKTCFAAELLCSQGVTEAGVRTDLEEMRDK